MPYAFSFSSSIQLFTGASGKEGDTKYFQNIIIVLQINLILKVFDDSLEEKEFFYLKWIQYL